MNKLHTLSVIFCTAFAVILLLAVTLLSNRIVFKGAEEYRFFVGHTSKDCREVRATAADAASVRLTLTDVCGESATYPSLDVDEFLKSVGGQILFTEDLSDSVNYYCRADLPYSVTLYGKTVNLHICVKDGGITVASPIIFGGY